MIGSARVVAALLGLLAGACAKEPPAPPAASSRSTGAEPGASGPAPAAAAAPGAARPAIAPDAPAAEVGKPAPDFVLPDLDGKEVRLSALRGKVVVLEWFNPLCPFVKKAHTVGSLKDASRKHAAAGVVWLAVNSAAPGKQGHGVAANRQGAEAFAIAHPILLDESGAVGKKYGATNTPHMFVVDPTGTLVYRGAIDNSPDGEGQSAPDGKLVSYVDEALAAIGGKRPVGTAETRAYGCSVKYAN